MAAHTLVEFYCIYRSLIVRRIFEILLRRQRPIIYIVESFHHGEPVTSDVWITARRSATLCGGVWNLAGLLLHV